MAVAMRPRCCPARAASPGRGKLQTLTPSSNPCSPSATRWTVASEARRGGPPERTEEELRRLLGGTWSLTVSRAQGQAAIDRGIERAVTEMNFFLQGITRQQVHDATPVNERIDIDFADDGRITVGFDQRYTYTTRPGFAQDFDVPGTGNVNVTQLFRSGHLEQVFVATLGRRWNTYEMSADGRTMTCGSTMQGPMMPVPVVFRLDYRQR
jgi:hypothetical protein